ncbi:MAG: L-rhamnose isomerase [Roseiflexus sp.]|nr:L-rhamnose isomerase [Roseiflexus sp.]
MKGMPWCAVWDMYCYRHGVPVGASFLNEVRRYEAETLAARRP